MSVVPSMQRKPQVLEPGTHGEKADDLRNSEDEVPGARVLESHVREKKRQKQQEFSSPVDEHLLFDF